MQVTVHGLGHVGLVAAACLAHSGHDVLGLDIDQETVQAVSAGRPTSVEPELEGLLREGLSSGRLRFAYVDAVVQTEAELALVCVGTPSLSNGSADLSSVRSALLWVLGHEPQVQAVVMKSTVPPGTGRILEHTILHEGRVAYVSNPEFLREGHAVHDWFHPDRIVIGSSNAAAEARVRALYHDIQAHVVVSDSTSTEVIKYGANAFLAVKVSFINEIANLCDRVGADIDAVASGIGQDPRIGSSYLRPGLGYGGSCFPKDVRALNFLFNANGHNFELLQSVIGVNNRQRLLPMLALREKFGPLHGIRVAVLGISFKPETDDTREAPALDLVALLLEEGAEVRVYDPWADVASVLPSSAIACESALAALDGAQAAVLATEWQEFVTLDWTDAARRMTPPKLLFDGRNALDQVKLSALGFDYRGVGRGRARKLSDLSLRAKG